MPDTNQPDPPRPGEAEQTVQIRTFLIADVRGYTLFTQERGDEAAAKLAAKFADIVREVVEARGGNLLELRGDEALCVFSSAREAIRTAVDVQQRFVEETLEQPELPLTVGIGLDAGEAVEVQGGYRGGALNLAARLCGQARAGEILASREVTHLARRVDGVRYEDRGSLSCKGLDEPVAVVRVVPDGDDPSSGCSRSAPPPPAPARTSAPVGADRRDRRGPGDSSRSPSRCSIRVTTPGGRDRDELDRADERGGRQRLELATRARPAARCQRDRVREPLGRPAGPRRRGAPGARDRLGHRHRSGSATLPRASRSARGRSG